MRMFVLCGVAVSPIVHAEPHVLVSVRAENMRDAARKLRGELTGRPPGTKHGPEELIPGLSAFLSRGHFQPSGDTAMMIAEAKRGGRHDPFVGGSIEHEHCSAETETLRLSSYVRFELLEVACIQ